MKRKIYSPPCADVIVYAIQNAILATSNAVITDIWNPAVDGEQF